MSVSPAHGRVPANVRAFRVRFSRPMRPRVGLSRAEQAIRLVDAAGRDLRAFGPRATWNDTHTEATLTVRAPAQGERLILTPGQTCRIVVTTGIRSGDGLPLAQRHEHRFRVGPASDAPIDPRLWKVAPPLARSLDELAIAFPYPLDPRSILAHVRVLDAYGVPIAGDLAPSPGATSVAFRPHAAWATGAVFVRVGPGLRDDVGNPLVAPFARFGAVFEAPSTTRAEPFEVGASLFPARPAPAQAVPFAAIGA